MYPKLAITFNYTVTGSLDLIELLKFNNAACKNYYDKKRRNLFCHNNK